MAGACPLVELSRSLNPGVPDEWLPSIMALTVYCDESETAGQIFTLAGWAGVPSGWERFCRPWREMLRCHGPEPVQAFHAIDLCARRGDGEFSKWPRKSRVAFLNRATEIVLDEKLLAIPYAVAASIEIKAFQKILPTWQPTTRDLYLLCFKSVFIQVLHHGVEQDISFVLDEKHAVETDVVKWFYEAKAIANEGREEPKIRGIAFDDDRVILPLQAADYLAYEIRRGLLNRRRDSHYVERQPYAALKKRQHEFRFYGERFLHNLAVAHAAQPEKSWFDLWFEVDAPED